MVYKFDPTYSTATIFDLDDSTRMMEKGWMEFVRENKPTHDRKSKRFLCFTPAEASSWCRSGRVQSWTDWPRRGRVHSGHHSSGTRQHGSIRCSMPFIPFAISPV